VQEKEQTIRLQGNATNFSNHTEEWA